MKIVLLVLFLISITNAKQSFMENIEYAKMLYKNPRGIGCDKCHGDKGEGMTISIYMKDGVEKELKAPRINNLSQSRFVKALSKKKSSLMPVYFLTKGEMAFLYYYLTNNNKKER